MTFGPENIGGVVEAWVADDLALSDGAAVSSWVGRVTAAALAQATGTKQPLYRTSSIGSQPAVDFDGSNDLLRYAGALSVAASGHVFLVMQPDTFDGTPWCEADEGSGTRYVLAYLNSSGHIDIEQRNADTDDIVTGNTALSFATDYLCEWQSLDTSFDLRVNGVLQTKTVGSGADNGDWFANVTGPDNFVVGALKRTTEDTFYNGKIAAVVVVNGTMSVLDRGRLSAWVQSKYGITLPDAGLLAGLPAAASAKAGLGVAVTLAAKAAVSASSKAAFGTGVSVAVIRSSVRGLTRGLTRGVA